MDKETPVDNKKSKKPRFKKKGPIRVEAIGPCAILTGLIIAYFLFLFDFHMKKSLEWIGTQVNGAEVNVGTFKTSFLKGTLLIADIQVTQVEEPTKNKVQIGDVQFQFLWDALLRAKFVVPLAAIHGIELNKARKSPGFVVPPSPEAEKKGESFFGTMKSKVMAKIQDQIPRNSLADAAKLLEGFDPTKQLKDLGELKSKARILELSNQLTLKQTEWTNALSTLPGDKDFGEIQGRINGIRVGGTNNPAEITNQINQATSIVTETTAKAEAVKTKGDTLTNDVGGFSKSVGELDELIKKDRLDLEGRLKLPKLDAKNLAEQLFGKPIMDNVAQVEKYIAIGRKYMPTKKDSQAKGEEEKPKRGVGKTYAFGKQNSYPRFWLKKAEVTSVANQSAWSGDIQGRITDVSSDPSTLGLPALLVIEGAFPQQGIQQVRFNASMDHTQDIPVESFKARVGTFPVSQKTLSDSDGLKFALGRASGAASLEGVLRGDNVSLTADSTFQKIDYQISAQSKILESLLQGVVKDIPQVMVQAKVSGKFDNLQVAVQSNLASALQKGFEKQLQARLEEARKKLDEMIQAQVGAKKKELTDRVDGVKNQMTAQVEEKKKKAEELKGQASGKIVALQNQAAAIQRQAQQALQQQQQRLQQQGAGAVKQKFGF